MNESALIVKGLEVWYNSNFLLGVQVTFSDDSRTSVFGQPSDSHASITFVPGERITELTLWGNGQGTRTGRIRLTTSAGQTFDVGKNTSGQKAYPAGLGSGILVGFVGRSGAAIDMLGPVFLNGSVQSISISNVVYTPPLTGSNTGISRQDLDKIHYYNPPTAKRNLPWKFNNEVKRTQTTTFTQSTTSTYGLTVSTEVSAELFGVGGKIGVGYSWEATNTQETSTSTSFEKTVGWEISGELQPGEGITATSFCQQGVGHANYTATVTLLLSDGTVSTYQEPGQFNTVVYTEAEVTVKPDN
ncbi:hypothetical protein BD309DRAFT_869954 [Dichomitus squalens]|uniref:Jacalin-type lectin domain-containing protein n=1 Tax=Dichomitus squalens TaxID=114155 RepID=A0A4Q9MP73_9APHY|nr:hypothetical protein BD311DRAFT_663919 [Dichomitus squalens]TBU40598.1 hypothetical protein BD309DRAFT_869954 [Dichomitus squalens]TBU57276.1 hypothetical protein BD310DRAFT_821984 [Dichomitus squalens]